MFFHHEGFDLNYPKRGQIKDFPTTLEMDAVFLKITLGALEHIFIKKSWVGINAQENLIFPHFIVGVGVNGPFLGAVLKKKNQSFF